MIVNTNNKQKMFYGETVLLAISYGLKLFDFSQEHVTTIKFGYVDFTETCEVSVVINFSGKEYAFPIYKNLELLEHKGVSNYSDMIVNSIVESSENDIDVIGRFIDCSKKVPHVYENNFKILDEYKRLIKECLNYSTISHKEVRPNNTNRGLFFKK